MRAFCTFPLFAVFQDEVDGLIFIEEMMSRLFRPDFLMVLFIATFHEHLSAKDFQTRLIAFRSGEDQNDSLR